MTTPNLTQSVIIFKDIGGKFNSVQWTQVLNIINSSQTLKAQFDVFWDTVA